MCECVCGVCVWCLCVCVCVCVCVCLMTDGLSGIVAEPHHLKLRQL